MNTQIWKHHGDGSRFAVGLDSNGVVVDVWGPLASDEEVFVALTGDWDGGMDPETLEAVVIGMTATNGEYTTISEVVTLEYDTVPLFASKDLPSGEYVEVYTDSNTGDYTILRCHMGYIQWQATDLSAVEVVEACKDWGLDGWTPTLHGE